MTPPKDRNFQQRLKESNAEEHSATFSSLQMKGFLLPMNCCLNSKQWDWKGRDPPLTLRVIQPGKWSHQGNEEMTKCKSKAAN